MPFDVFSPEGELVLSYGAPLPAPAPQLVPLPELVIINCTECQGEGCEACGETGRLEVCAECEVQPDGATDECGCDPTAQLLAESRAVAESCRGF